MAKLQKFTCVDDVPNLEQALQECIDIKNNPLGTPDFGKNKTVGLVS
jgi:N-succinyl-L-ornithine transcarbamylase